MKHNMLISTGALILRGCANAGRGVWLFIHTQAHSPKLLSSRKQLIRQLDHAGFGSIVVLALVAGLTGMIMSMQTGHELAKYGVLDRMGAIIGATFTREMGPLWAAIIILARVGSAMAAELGTMVVNEEVDALKVMSIDPVRYLVLPRMSALIIAMPLLCVIADVVGLWGGALVSKSQFGLPYRDFWQSAKDLLTSADIYTGLVKASIFGAIIATIACDQGLNTRGGAEGVGRATTISVMLNVIFVLIADFILGSVNRMLSTAGLIG